MKAFGWVMFFGLAILYVILAIETLDFQAKVKRALDLNVKSAELKLEARKLDLENERMRNKYLKVVLDAQGVKEW